MDVYLENSKSKSGKHAIRTLIFVVEGNNFTELKLSKMRKVQGIYKIGEAGFVELPDNKTYVYIFLVKTIQNKVKGRIIVVSEGKEKMLMNYRKLKLKLIRGDKEYVDLVKKIFDKLNIPVKKVNLRAETNV